MQNRVRDALSRGSLAQVVQGVESTVHWMSHFQMNKSIEFDRTYPVYGYWFIHLIALSNSRTTEAWGPFLESPETLQTHLRWQNSLCIFKTKLSRGAKLCSYFNFYFLYYKWKDQLYRISGRMAFREWKVFGTFEKQKPFWFNLTKAFLIWSNHRAGLSLQHLNCVSPLNFLPDTQGNFPCL